MADDIVLNFEDSLLRKSDVELLERGRWLNDKIIGFMFEYFEYILYDKLEDVLFVNPDVAQYIKLCQGAELAMFLEPLNLHSKSKIFIPVNSNTNPDAVGGTHWSLLVYDAQEKKFQHYDSCTTSNNSHAVQMSKAMEPFLKVKQGVCFVEERCPQQENTYDCGMYVICITEKLCKRLQDGVNGTNKGFHGEVNAETVTTKRTEIKNIIEDLRHKHPSST